MTSFKHDTVVPDKHSALNKKEQVAAMFNHIATKYDFLNRFLSAGIDIGWRKKAIKEISNINPLLILDVATGTADLAILSTKILTPKKVIGIDISEGMLEIGKMKVKKRGLEHIIELKNGDSECLPFSDNTFDAVTVAFGVRNFQNLMIGLAEIKRVIKPGGKMVVLEFSKPTFPIVKQLYSLYMNIITPWAGKFFSKNKEAYSYLDKSIKLFPESEDFIHLLNTLDFRETYCKKLSFGICSIYCGTK